MTSASDSPSSSSSKPDAVERREGVGARERRDAVDVESDQPVGGTRRTAPRTGRRTEVGEVTRCDHLEQLFGALVERELLAARRACRAEVRVPGDHRDRLGRDVGARRRQPPHDRHGANARGHLLVPVGRRRVDDACGVEGLGHEVAPLILDLLADEVAIEEGRRARRARVRHGDEFGVARGHPQHDVGEREVGEQLQIADEHVQPVDVGRTAAALGEDEITEGRHGFQRSARRPQPVAVRRTVAKAKPRRRTGAGTGGGGRARNREWRCAASTGPPRRAGYAR